MKLTRKTREQTCLIEIRRGERVKEKNGKKRSGRIIDFRLVPNGIDDPTLVCLVVVELDNGNRVCCCASEWELIPGIFYVECYPSILMGMKGPVVETEAAQITNDELNIEITNPISVLEVE